MGKKFLIFVVCAEFDCNALFNELDMGTFIALELIGIISPAILCGVFNWEYIGSISPDIVCGVFHWQLLAVYLPPLYV